MSIRSEHVDEMGIGEFASRSRLSARALRIYVELGLLALGSLGVFGMAGRRRRAAR